MPFMRGNGFYDVCKIRIRHYRVFGMKKED